MLKHPSGRPIRKPVVKRSEPVWHCPLTEPAVPRLRKPAKGPVADAIGFQIIGEKCFDDSYARRHPLGIPPQ